MSLPEVLYLRYHHLEFIKYLGTISIMGEPVGYQMDEDNFGDNKATVQEWVDHLTELSGIPIIWIEGADSVCDLCKHVDKLARICGEYSVIDRDRSLLPEEIRRRADAEVKAGYDVDTVKTLGDIFKLERKPVFKRI